jgi:hypothetical protein
MTVAIRITGENYSQVDNTFILQTGMRLNFKNQDLSCIRLSIRNLVYNISSQYQNNYVSWTNNGVACSTTIPNGYYTTDDLNTYFNSISNNVITLTRSAQTDSISMEVFAPNSVFTISQQFGALIGYTAGTYTSGSYTSSLDAIDPVLYVQLCTTELTDSNPINKSNRAIAIFNPRECAFGDQFVYHLSEPIPFPIIDGTYSQIAVRLVDNLFRPINTDNNICLDLVVSPRSEDAEKFFGY